MSRQDKTLPPRRRRATSDVSLLIRSAETLGKLIGALQRQLDGASKRASRAKPKIRPAASATASAASGARASRKTAASRRGAGAAGKNSKGGRRTS